MRKPSTFEKPEPLKLVTSVGELAGLKWGDSNQRLILALHGWLDNAASFSSLAPLLKNAQVVALDLPGHGHSEHRKFSDHYQFIDYIPTVLQSIKSLGWKSCILLGHSLGGAIATFVAVADPSIVTHLILIDGLGPRAEVASKAAIQLSKATRRSRTIHTKVSGKIHPNLEAMINARLQVNHISREGARIIVERNAVEVNNGFGWRTDPRLLWPSPQYMTEEQVLTIFKANKVPTLLAMAKDGYLQSRAETANRINAFLNIRVVEFQGNHHFHLDDPGPIAKEINLFIS